MAIALPLVSASASIVTLSSPGNKTLKTTTTLPFISANTPSFSSRKSPSRNLSLPRVAAPPATPTSYENQKEEEDVDEHGEESSSSSKFSWRDHWYPVSLIEDLDPSLPTPFQLLGRDLVLWFDRKGGLMKAATCSVHTMVGHLMGADLVLGSLRLHLKVLKLVLFSLRELALPTMQSQGLLFVWPDENGLERARATKPPRLPDDFDKPEFSSVTIQRDLFYGYDTLIENVSDPSHIDFAHHKFVQDIRGRNLNKSSGHWGFAGANDGNPRITAEFVAPCIISIKIDGKLPIVGNKKWIIWICSFNVPMAPGKIRSIVCSARNFFQLTMPGPAWWQVVPRWHEHWTSNKVYDGDMIVLQGQEKIFLSKTMEGSSDVNKQYTNITFTPTQADRLVLAFRDWLRRHGNSQPEWFGMNNQQPMPSTVLSKLQV
ncbi:hypothetical protein FH972_010140 [Carpinus fangiana]|uniref:Pheophorbide a oxygenase domain-containing protein n=1 Tax=Carpinus fangiana TaxID=176857 RepID=A0A660KTH6_9ROSI|nr:hypothetical protein FH972_010140 [Carpinus fangiana]